MKQKNFCLLILGIVIIAMNSCNKADNVGNEDNRVLKVGTFPYDSLGIAHNLALRYALNENLLEESSQTMYGEMTDELERNGIFENWPSFSFVDSVWSPIENHIISDSSYSIAVCAYDLYSQGKINSIQLRWFVELDSIVNSNFGSASYSTSIGTFESNLHATSRLTTSQKDIILIASSIAKYSGEFWAEYESSLKSVQYKWWQWGFIVGADVAGGIGGAPGGVGGIIGGAACCSALAMAIFSE